MGLTPISPVGHFYADDQLWMEIIDILADTILFAAE